MLREAPEPSPGPGEVRIRTRLAGVNFADVMVRLGLYPGAPALPCVPGYELCGVVDAVGDGVAAGRVGERVLALTRFGGYAEAVCVPATHAFAVPAGVTDEAAAALPLTYLTAYVMLHVLAPVQPRQRVLVNSAAGGVGIAAAQLVRLGGGELLASASPGKHAFVRGLGATLVLDSRADHYHEAVREATGGQGADIVLEPRHGRWIMEGYRALGCGGRLVLHGFASATEGGGGPLGALRALARVPWLRLNPVALMNDNKSIAGLNLATMWHETRRLQAWMAPLLGWLADGSVAPVIDQVVPAARAGEAQLRLQRRENVGKVLLDFRRDGGAA